MTGWDLQGLLQVRKTESFGQTRNFVDKRIGEFDFVVGREFRLPVFAVQAAFFEVGVIEQATYTYRSAGQVTF